jgi:ribosomal protein L19E
VIPYGKKPEQEKTMSETEVKDRSPFKEKLVRWAIFAAALLIAFLVGFVPMWMKASDQAAEHEVTKKALTRSDIGNLIARSVVEARRGEYESARQSTSDFFTRLNAEIEKGEGGAYPAEQNDKLRAVFTDRDAVITLLARRDPASVERLNDIYLIYRQAIGETVSRTESQPPASDQTDSNQ